LIFIDPPTFSNSKRMNDVLDVQRDHVRLIAGAARVLRAAGRIMFSTNYSKFKLDQAALSAAGLHAVDITAATIPLDFERNAAIHRCFDIQWSAAQA
jgi:23S rRNA (guanine2445-N2)-methyltransferase / 23S rRNA (guanine2069-N7)-methyltransferase